jgi:hypothetical protein
LGINYLRLEILKTKYFSKFGKKVKLEKNPLYDLISLLAAALKNPKVESVGSVVTKKYKLGQKKPMTSLAFAQILNFLEYNAFLIEKILKYTASHVIFFIYL